MKTKPTVKKAANAMLGIAVKVGIPWAAFLALPEVLTPVKPRAQEYIENRGHELMDDDTTIVCVELNPSGIPYVAPPAAGCCLVQ